MLRPIRPPLATVTNLLFLQNRNEFLLRTFITGGRMRALPTGI